MTRLARRRFPVVLSAPSGTGKTTLAHALVDGNDGFSFSVSTTTRERRAGEVEGTDYHFTDEPSFRAMADAGGLAEWADVHGRLYGTPRDQLVSAAERGDHIVLDIDVQGARQIRTSVPDALSIFVLPPSVESLLERLTGRGTEPPREVARRLASARHELEAAAEFDYVVVNDRLERCVDEILSVIRAERLRVSRVTGLDEEVARMRSRIGAVLDDEYANIIG